MARPTNTSHTTRISPAFLSRLEQLDPKQKVRALVLVYPRGETAVGGRRQSPADRRAALEAVRQAVEAALPEIDAILGQHGGKRLADNPNALGYIPVETTAGGVRALAAATPVQAILEDQAISSAYQPRY